MYFTKHLLRYDNLINTQASLNSNKIAWWLGMDNTSGGKYFYDLLELSHGEIISSPSQDYGWKGSARPGSFVAVRLSGNGDYISISDADKFKFDTNNFTVSGWFYLETLNNPNSNGKQTIFSRYETSILKGFSIDVTTSGEIIFHVSLNAVSNTNFTSAAGVIAANTWYHFTAVRFGLIFYLFLNGKQQVSGTIASSWSLSSGSQNLLIGDLLTNGGSHQYLQGYVDDICIYNWELLTPNPFRIYEESLLGYPNTLNRFALGQPYPIASPWLYIYMMQNSYGVTL
jgi:hypothetical protein